MPAKIHVQQIFYDQATRSRLDPGFIPLDNCANERPDWYEFWVIKNHLERHALDPDTWYGFLSTKFQIKTGLNPEILYRMIETCEQSGYEVFLPTAHWDRIVLYRNPYIQGEMEGHRGIIRLTQNFCDHIGFKYDIENSIAHTENFTYCNYIIAKPRYWQAWLRLAQAFFDVTETSPSPLGDRLRNKTAYRNQKAPIKTFIQERFPYLIIQNENLKSRSTSSTLLASLSGRQGEKDIHTLNLMNIHNIMRIFH